MNDQFLNQILASLSKIEAKVDAINSSLSETKQDLVSQKEQINNIKENINELYNLHTKCEETKCQKYQKIADLEKKLSFFEMLWKGVVGIGSLIIIILTIAKFFGIG
jgi:chromosome segregation ATPase